MAGVGSRVRFPGEIFVMMLATRTDQARLNMIEQQIRPWDVLDPRVLNLLAALPREDFAPEAYKALAFCDLEIPLTDDPDGPRMMRPNLEGRILQALAPEPGEQVLEIGTGSGYLSACLARLGGRVTTVEIDAVLAEAARERLRAHGIRNAHVQTGDAREGWGAGERYGAVAVTGAMYELTDAYRELLAVGGRMFVIVGVHPSMEAQWVIRTAERQWRIESLFETDIAYLEGLGPRPRFTF